MNPNFPTIEHGWGSRWDANGGLMPIARYVDLTKRSQGTVATQRGRQYELDQVQSGTLSGQLVNTDGALDPTNGSGPWAGHIWPYQPYRVRAQWPPTANLLPPTFATGGDNHVPGDDLTGELFGISTPPSVVASATAWQGTHVLQSTISAGTLAGVYGMYTWAAATIPGETYSLTMHVRNVTSGTTVNVLADIAWFDADGTLISQSTGTGVTLTGSPTAAWTTITATGVAPVNVAEVSYGVATQAVPAAACGLQSDGNQVEIGAVPTAWVTPGTWYPMFSGFLERLPQTWSMSGTLGVVTPTAVDAFALLSQRTLNDPLTEELSKYSPRFLYKLDDPQGSSTASDATGQNPAAQIQHGKYGAFADASVDFGTQVTAADPINGVYTGSTDSVATFNNPNPGRNIFGASAYLSLDSAGIVGPVSSAAGWTRIIAFRYTGPKPPTGEAASIWAAYDNNFPSGSSLALFIGDDGGFKLNISGANGVVQQFVNPSWVSPLDGNWHLAVVVWDAGIMQMTVRLDQLTRFFTLPASVLTAGIAMDSVGALVDKHRHFTSENFAGDISFVAELPVPLNTGQMRDDLTFAWLNSFSGDSTDVRYNRILDYASYSGTRAIGTGATQSMGPANLDQVDALSALQAVVDTENGEHFVSADGTVTFKPRTARYNTAVPAYIFGEAVAAGEWPYEDAQLDYDPTHLGNIAQITQESTGGIFTAQDVASQTRFFPRTLQRTVNASAALECQDAASYLVSRYKIPLTRVSTLVLHPSAFPALWVVALSLELGMRIRVVRRPPGRSPITIECFVENLSWNATDTNDVTLTLQCSPADLTPYGVIAAWHSTLAAPATAGATTITVNAPAGSHTPIAAQLPVPYDLWVGPGHEVVTIKSLPTTSPTWTTAVITLAGPTGNAHASGEAIYEGLPDSNDLPSAWDGTAVFDATAFTY